MADSSENKVAFELVTPVGLLTSEEVDMVVVPGSAGDFGVLPGHAPLSTTVRPGVINVHNDRAVTRSLFVEGGFAEATPERCTVLAEGATDVADISAEDAKARLSAAEETYDAADDDAKEAAENELDIARAQAHAAGASASH